MTVDDKPATGLAMTETHPRSDTVTAAPIVPGEEILSGRTRDENISHIARYLTDIGIALQEVRVVRDVEVEIIVAVNELRARYVYVFTTGGIGPTHDDVTTDAIASAFGVGVEIDPRAVEAMRQGYSELELTPARLRMARIPKGAELVDNLVSRAPGFMLGNVIVMAGVPRIMQVMLDAVAPRLKKGRPMLSRSIRIEAPEGDVATGLAAIQAAHADVKLGSYTFFEKGSSAPTWCCAAWIWARSIVCLASCAADCQGEFKAFVGGKD
jgi:molybdopterin-biosynthesis enzyme MoeA-like protein